MNRAQLESIADGLWFEAQDILLAKGKEYVRDTDVLGNFKVCSKLTGVTPEQALLIFMTKHYEAIGTYIRQQALAIGEPYTTESIRGRAIDLINYAVLFEALRLERLDQLELDRLEADADKQEYHRCLEGQE